MGRRGGLERGAEGRAARPRVSRDEALERLSVLRSSGPGAIVGTDEAGRGASGGARRRRRGQRRLMGTL